MSIRDEEPADIPAIRAVVQAAFARDAEADLVERLRADGDSIISLVAVEDGRIVGHVLLSRMAAPFRALGLAPVSVAPDRQRSGIGSALIREGLTRCKALGFDAVAVLGDPDYYKKFGFTLDAARVLESEYSGDHFQAVELNPGVLAGGSWKLVYPSAFSSV